MLDTGSQVSLLSEDNVLDSPEVQQTSREDDAVIEIVGHPTGVCVKTSLILSLGGDEWTGMPGCKIGPVHSYLRL